ncbi:MAG: peroxiredoxin [Beijerinckiaceae bacterium]|nr:peroxiredoxin [Beijerinckiaceae bacterium]
MTIQSGDRIPKAAFTIMTPDGPELRTSDQIFKGRKVVLFGVPGAFTPLCDKQHLPGFLDNAGAFKARGIDDVAVTGVNDIFVMDAWAKSTGAVGKITFLADGNGDFARALGLTLDLTARGLGIRSQRYAMIVDDGVVQKLNLETSPGKVETSSAQALLNQL